MPKSDPAVGGQYELLAADEQVADDHPHAASLTDEQLGCRAGSHPYPDRGKWRLDFDASTEHGVLLASKLWKCACGLKKTFYMTAAGGHDYGSVMDYSGAEGYLQDGTQYDLARREDYRREELKRQLGVRELNKLRRQAVSSVQLRSAG